ncbi:hypothetical protein CNMCM6936_003545 [Aspergillus lentulus]|uniref:Protein kinase domain-containing protein n=1 Tax=Aspergillus lentulus TaxID=293939 RepID=A0AAN5YGW8_ASPLE|nr:hypothetical protein CNMCM6069_003066 [Aspergillus lentulus]KAF4161232.1 hypothetical protein CNMCM6936_003545 [Aspergillus lentulus]KAF4200555.1 hypothetical protein CNMCM8927_002946 [Aspergillus lentulus]
MERKVLDKNAAAAAAAQKAASSKIHAPPPPSLVVEPAEGGERYSTGAFLGKGGFAICYEGTLLRNGRVFAMKVVRAEMAQKKMQEKFRTELQIHSKMRHPHIVEFHRAFAFDKCIYVVLELCPNGSVMDMLCGAVKYLHKRSVAHRDLKMGNLFLDRNMDIKVGDFGLAAMIISEKDEKRRKTLCGTPNYIAPEVLDKSKGGHTQKVDIWSLGIICFAMLTGYPPFQSKTQEEIYKKVRNLTYVWPSGTQCANHIPDEAKSLVSSCLNLSENERPDPDDIVEHPFFNMSDEPRGDRMMLGHSLEYDEKLSGYIEHVDDLTQRYLICRTAFYSLCGVGRKPDGTARKSVGKNCSKSAFAECLSEEEKGMQPVMPLPEDMVYRYPSDPDGDWSTPSPGLALGKDDSSLDGTRPSGKRTVSMRSNSASLSRTQAALAAAQQRRKEPQSHAATLRQQAMGARSSVRRIAAICDLPAVVEPESAAPVVPTGGLAERPIRARRGVAVSYSGSTRDLDRKIVPSTSDPGMLTVGKTRSQSRRLGAASNDALSAPAVIKERPVSSALDNLPTRLRQSSARSVARQEALQSSKRQELEEEVKAMEVPSGDGRLRTEAAVSRSSSKTASTSSSKRSTLGVYPLLHPDDHCEMMPRTSLEDVNTDLRLMLSNLVPPTSGRRRVSSRRTPHAYVIKWVDYTNRYGIGYVLDDGSVGCVFKAENGQPASGVLLRNGERHIRRKARSLSKQKDAASTYSEADQLVPRNGKPVEFYENCEITSSDGLTGIRRALIPPSVFEVKPSSDGSSGAGIKVRTNSGLERARADAEKIKRVKLVDQFGKYMIGSLGRHDDDDVSEDDKPTDGLGQFIKFYQRLGNVGVWGFGDGAFQFNFPDHTKLVISPGRTRASSPWIDFYHLSPSAARYLSAKGKMHPSGFDTRAVASDEATAFLSIAHGSTMSSVDERIRDVLEANFFLEKISFIKEVMKSWVKHGRLGGGPSQDQTSADASKMLWEGIQERAQLGGGKFVWVTVGAPGGDGEYRSISLKEKETEGRENDPEMEPLRERLRALATKP